MDSAFLTLAEMFVELLVVIYLLGDVCKLFETRSNNDFRGHSQNLGLPQSLLRDAQKKILPPSPRRSPEAFY